MRAGHTVARGPHPRYPPRTEVPDDKVEWSTPWPDYAPIEFVTDKVLSESPDRKPKGWADRDEPPEAAVLKKRGSHELQALAKPWAFDPANNRPMNPRGRTGVTNRGTLGKWGPNHAGDAIVTRYNLSLPHRPLEFVAIKRRETGHWAMPGGMVDPGEIAMATLRREFREEAANLPQSEQMRVNAVLDEVFAPENGRVIYRGYVDDPRNTGEREHSSAACMHTQPIHQHSLTPCSLSLSDNAWMETVAMHFHVAPKKAEALPLKAGDDAAEVRWLAISDDIEGMRCQKHSTGTARFIVGRF